MNKYDFPQFTFATRHKDDYGFPKKKRVTEQNVCVSL